MNSEKRSAFTVIEMLVASVLATGMTIAAFLIVSTMTAKVSSVDKVNGSGEHAALRIVEVRIRNDFDLSHHYQKIETGVRLFGSCRSDQNANFRIHDECAVDYSVEPIGGRSVLIRIERIRTRETWQEVHRELLLIGPSSIRLTELVKRSTQQAAIEYRKLPKHARFEVMSMTGDPLHTFEVLGI